MRKQKRKQWGTFRGPQTVREGQGGLEEREKEKQKEKIVIDLDQIDLILYIFRRGPLMIYPTAMGLKLQKER